MDRSRSYRKNRVNVSKLRELNICKRKKVSLFVFNAHLKLLNIVFFFQHHLRLALRGSRAALCQGIRVVLVHVQEVLVSRGAAEAVGGLGLFDHLLLLLGGRALGGLKNDEGKTSRK